ncbi:hypothetical protein BDR04DRAFT_1144681 [Suillus decipiens]|nr:hypothetical protein BDR04DRAFT_1144681 [Suillus decipiens]
MSFAFPAGSRYASRTPDAASSLVVADTHLRTPDATSHLPTDQVLQRAPGAALYQAVDRAVLHSRAPLLVVPSSADSNNIIPFRRPSFSSVTQPMIHSPSAYKSRTLSSTTRAQHQVISAAPVPVRPPRVHGPGMVPSRYRTVSSGPSASPSASVDLVPSFPVKTARQNDPALADRSHHAASRHATASKTLHKIVHQHSNQPPVHQSFSSLQQHLILKDVTLINAVTVAARSGTEFRWYPVWVIAIKDWMFLNASTGTVACNLAPQYALEYTQKPPTPSPGSTPGSLVRSKKSWVIPDFAQILQYVQTASNGSRIRDIQKVILLVENKPKVKRQDVLFPEESPLEDSMLQIRKQAVYAFLADPTLQVIGTILALGSLWRYVEINRPRDDVLITWFDHQDRSYGQRKKAIAYVVPDELRLLSGKPDYSFELLDKKGRSALAFEIIARRIKIRESKMWNL